MSLQKSIQQKEIDEDNRILLEKENLKKQIKKTSAYKDKNNVLEPADVKWKKRKQQIEQEIIKDCTFQPQSSPMKLAKNLIKNNDKSPMKNVKQNISSNPHKVENVHDRLYNDFKNNLFEYNGGVNFSKVFKECNPITSSTVFNEEDLNPNK